MAWTSTGTGEILVSRDVSKSCFAQKHVDFDNGEDAAIRYQVHADIWFFATTTRTVKVIRGLTRAAAEAKVAASGANVSTWKTSTKTVSVVSCTVPFEAYTKTTSCRRVDQSGQYEVEIVETSTTTDGTEKAYTSV